MNAAGRRRRSEGQRGNQQQLCVLSSSPQWTSAWVCDQNSQRVETRTQALQSFTSSPHTSFSSPTSPPQTSSSDLLSFYPSVFHPSFSSDLGLSPPSFLLLFSFVSPCFLPHPLLYFYTSLFCFSTFLLFVLLSLFPCFLALILFSFMCLYFLSHLLLSLKTFCPYFLLCFLLSLPIYFFLFILPCPLLCFLSFFLPSLESSCFIALCPSIPSFQVKLVASFYVSFLSFPCVCPCFLLDLVLVSFMCPSFLPSMFSLLH